MFVLIIVVACVAAFVIAANIVRIARARAPLDEDELADMERDDW